MQVLLSSQPNSKALDYGISVAWMLADNEHWEAFNLGMKLLTPAQQVQVFLSSPQNSKALDYGVPVAWILAENMQWEAISSGMQLMSSEQRVMVLQCDCKGRTILGRLCERGEDRLLDKMLDSCEFSDLLELYNNTETEATESPAIVNACFKKMTVAIQKSLQGLVTEVSREELNDWFSNAYRFFTELVEGQSEYSSGACQSWSSLMMEAIQSGHAKLFIEWLEALEDNAFADLKKTLPNNTLSAYSLYLDCMSLNSRDKAMARNIALKHVSVRTKKPNLPAMAPVGHGIFNGAEPAPKKHKPDAEPTLERRPKPIG